MYTRRVAGKLDYSDHIEPSLATTAVLDGFFVVDVI